MNSSSPAPRSGTPDLAGRRILVPRDGATGERWAAAIRERGGEAIVVALTETAPPEDSSALADAVERWNRGTYDWLVLTSANGAHAVADAGARPGAAEVAAVGPATAEALRERGFRVMLQPEHDFSAAGLAEALLDRIGIAAAGTAGAGSATGRPADPADVRRLLLPLSEIASDELERALAAAGHVPERVTAYRTLPAPRDAVREAEIVAGGVDAILVLSGSGAAELVRRFGPPRTGSLPGGSLLAAIGEPTARALAAHGLRADAVAPRHTVDGLLDALAARLADPAFPSETPDPEAADPAAPGPAAPDADRTTPSARPVGSRA
jgi:uroporphyrinogen-III synthase